MKTPDQAENPCRSGGSIFKRRRSSFPYSCAYSGQRVRFEAKDIELVSVDVGKEQVTEPLEKNIVLHLTVLFKKI